MFDLNINSGAIASLILNGLPMGLLFCDRDGIIRYINKAYANLLSITPQDALGKPITSIIPKSRAYEVMQKGSPELEELCQLGSDRPVIVNRLPVADEHGKIIGMISQAIFKDPDELHRLSARVERLDKKISLYRRRFQASLAPQYTFASIYGASESLQRLKRQACCYAHLDEPVLITGETGCGKELFAHAIHSESPRGGKPLVCINCASIPRELFESELFGYEKGAFTGGRQEGKIGQMELADGGSLFLDEIGDLPPEIQAKLLRVLETHTICRLGSVTGINVDFRLMAATNRNLAIMIKNGTFREDLYYRINTFVIEIPPLRERTDDIEPIALATLKRMALDHVKLAPETLEAMQAFSWPGNARQLRNAIIHAATMRQGDVLYPENFPPETVTHASPPLPGRGALESLAAHAEAQAILRALKATGFNVAAAAKKLQISRATIYEKMRRYGITREQK